MVVHSTSWCRRETGCSRRGALRRYSGSSKDGQILGRGLTVYTWLLSEKEEGCDVSIDNSASTECLSVMPCRCNATNRSNTNSSQGLSKVSVRRSPAPEPKRGQRHTFSTAALKTT
ncbi:unnamed protein product [Ectocarpus sp. 12 AP-2014]